MKTGIDSSAYRDEADLAAGYRRMRRHGYDCVDYQELVNTETPLFAAGESEFERLLREEADIIRGAGLEISQTHGPWRYPPRDAEEADRAERFDKMARALHGTRVMGCPYMVIHPIMPFGTGGDGDRARFFEINFDYYRRLSRVAEAEGVIICLENMPMPELPLARPAEILAFVKEIDSPALRVCLDTGHCTMCGVQPADAVRELGIEYLRVLHVHDNDGRRDLHWLPWRGVIDWAAFSQALHDVGFSGALSLETRVKAALPAELREYFEIGLGLIARRLTEG
ncbi:MAG: sugar phosphate isomerase/epimerase [Clostridia bacterium]|nr:sugar phosphate isomerase/epimerase [Clostridia bacterium]